MEHNALKKTSREASLPNKRPAYSLVVDYDKPVEEMIKSGLYDVLDGDITSKRFPTKRVGKTEIAVKLVHFNRPISNDEAIKELNLMGYRPAKFYELLAFGEKYPEIQRKFPIIAPGSVWRRSDGRRYIPYLDSIGSKRGLFLVWFGRFWVKCVRFAAVRK
ncbi:MAG: hypothetical protein V1756_02030 [Patescibacteria group bacterium]